MVGTQRRIVSQATNIDPPKLLDGVESDNFLEEIVPIVSLGQVSTQYWVSIVVWLPYLSARGLGKPQRPFVHQGVLDIEVVRIVEDSDLLVSAVCL